MKLETFLKRLKKTPRKWYLTPRSDEGLVKWAIRFGSCEFSASCPITAILRKPVSAYDVHAVASRLRIPRALKTRIIRAADNRILNLRGAATLRKKLLAACGLTEPDATTKGS